MSAPFPIRLLLISLEYQQKVNYLYTLRIFLHIIYHNDISCPTDGHRWRNISTELHQLQNAFTSVS